ncbi:MAG TPA: glycosyltransferase [Acidimicrobiales bacterium]|nr:glycosyltransferase [Acidimicrobiales bacterium]
MTVVIATRDRTAELRRTLSRLAVPPDASEVIVVDNGSAVPPVLGPREGDGTARLIRLPANLAAAGRSVGARLARTPYVAFCDDDTWWEPGALTAAADRLDADPGTALVAARVLVGSEGSVDPTSEAMEQGPLDEELRPATVGHGAVTGFLACAAMVRRAAYLAVGGFEPYLVIGGEEELAALDLIDAGWKLVYEPAAVVRHFPSRSRDGRGRSRLQVRNGIIVGGLRYSLPEVARRWRTSVMPAVLPAAGWVTARRRPVAPAVETAFLGSAAR